MKHLLFTQKRTKLRIAFIAVLWVLIMVTGCWMTNIDTPYYTQSTDYYCGAASAQMVLDSENIGIYISPQSVIYDYIHSHNICSGWASDPHGLADALNHFADGRAYFSWYAPTDQDAGNNKLAYTLDYYEVPPIALIYGSAHWIVVRGVYTSAQPTTVSDYDIYGFYVNDPWYGTTTLGENMYIDSRTWNEDIFTGGFWCGAPGARRYISVVDPDPPTKAVPSYPARLEKRTQVFTPIEIEKLASGYLKNLLNSKIMAKNFNENTVERLSVAKVGEPRLTRRLDRKNDAYYIIPLLAADGHLPHVVQGVILFDAYRGEFKAISAVEKAVPYAIIDNQNVALATFKNTFDLRMHQVEKITSCERVWAPSTQSRSPFFPLWEVQGVLVGEQKPTVLGYMNQDGQLFRTVTPLNKTKLKGGGH